MERTLYNGLISGVSLDGKTFFYPNPLESAGQHRRSPWFGVACCPGNITRFLPSVPGYVYAQRGDALYVNLFIGSTADIKLDNGGTGLTALAGALFIALSGAQLRLTATAAAQEAGFRDVRHVRVLGGLMAIHVAINRANNGAAEFWRKMGFADLALDGSPEGRTVWKGRA